MTVTVSEIINLLELDHRIYSESELERIIEFDGTMFELNTHYPIRCLRQTGDLYRVSYRGKNEIAIMYYDKEGQKLSAGVYIWSIERRSFDSLKIQDSVQTVMDLDPNGDYVFLFTGRNDYRTSLHYTVDGYLIAIEYDSDNKIEAISIELI